MSATHAEALRAAVRDLEAAEVKAQAAGQAILAARDRVQRVADALGASQPPPPPPAKAGAWGKGPKSGLPWFSGARCQSQSQLDGWLKAGRPTKPVDVITCMSGGNMAETWAEVAGGATDSPDELKGLLSLTEGQRSARFIWQTFPDLPAVYTMRPIPLTDSNQGGKNPRVWERIAKGEMDWVWIRQGRKLGGLDARFNRIAPTILEIGHEMTGAWYPHSIHGAVPWYPTAFARIVASIRKGYRVQTGKDCPYLFWVRPSRGVKACGVWTDAILPPAEAYDGLGLSQHDNHTSACTPDSPRRNWTRDGINEGLENVAELAEARGKLMGFWEWSSHHPDASWNSGPHPDVFTRSMWDFLNANLSRLVGETYFLSSETTFAGHPDWPGTIEYRRTWGA